MPIILDKDTSSGRIIVWRITETIDSLFKLVTKSDAQSTKELRSIERILGRLAWRAAFRAAQPNAGEIVYLPSGGPALEDSTLGINIGVSHCLGYAAVIFGSKPCAIDIEPAARDFSRAAARYISAQEATMAQARDSRFAGVIWGAKETLYKYSGLRKLDLKRDIAISEISFSTGGETIIEGRVRDSEVVRMGMTKCDGIHIIYTL